MSALAKIKKSASQFEQERQYDKALAEYARLLDGGVGSDEEIDVTLYNRAGDLALRAGDVPRAVTYFERAIDLYAAGGFLNNAVALAVKILRHAPGHLAAHHTLGVLYGRKGFRAEARQHLADYAAQMHRAGRGDEVRRTLAELAALGTASDDVTAVRELLTARAAGPDDAGALVKGFDDALGPVGARAGVDRAGSTPPARPAIALSELIEFEVRGPRLTPALADAAARPPIRWNAALPNDPDPLRLSALARPALPVGLELIDLDPPDTAAPEWGVLDLDSESADVEVFEIGGFDVDGSELDALHVDSPLADPAAVDAALIDVSLVDRPPTELSLIEGLPLGIVDAGAGAFADAQLLDLTAGAADAAAASSDSAHPFEVQRDVDVFSAPDPVAFVDDEPADSSVEAEAAIALSFLDAGVSNAVSPPDLIAPSPLFDEPTDLGEWLRSTETEASTRLTTPAPQESGDEAADFDAALLAFKAGIAQSVDVGDRESHYDLGVAFREMGLFTDAVREFQRALAAPGSGLREREALAQCFLDLERPELALVTLEAAAAAAFADGAPGETLVGVFYVLAEAACSVGRTDDARGWYVRVLAADYAFRDAATRLAALPPPVNPIASR